MQLSKTSYYADFFIYPLACIVWSVASLWGRSRVGVAEWLCALVFGMVFWTFLEYVLHRIALHRMAYFSPLHGVHHSAPLAFVGTPTWISISVFTAFLWVPARFSFGFGIASALTIGVMLGYWWYGIVHHLIHHPAHRPSSPRLRAYFGALSTRHLRHHYSPQHGNFGVSTALWDHVFGTSLAASGKIWVAR